MRTLIIAAHPDDEVIGLGGQLHSFRDLYVVHLTNGAPPGSGSAYASTRRSELHAALALSGIGRERTTTLGLTDQESSLHLRDAAEELSRIISRLHPAIVYTHPYEGGHPDHDSAAWIARAALRVNGARAILKEFTSYHNGNPAGADAWLKTGAFLGGAAQVPQACILGEAQRERKQQMFDCFESQRDMLKHFPIGVELVRNAPYYDFRFAPHPGTLFYETQPWRNTGAEWRARAMAAE
jgi:LmbE family N-acetylglucosaminyl deacetylase